MELKVILLIFTVFCCSNSQSTPSSADGLRKELLKRADELQAGVKSEIVKLQVEKREHLAYVLNQESYKVKLVANELRNSKVDPIRLALLEAELIQLEFNLNKELSILERESLTQEELVSSAQILKKWAEEESKKLKTQNNEHAHQAYLLLQKEVAMLDYLVSVLSKAQTQIAIETIEVELRAIEIRIYETLRHLGFRPNTSRTLHYSMTTPNPTTLIQNTLFDRTRLSMRTTRTHITHSPFQRKDELLKKANELVDYTNTQMARLDMENRTTETETLQSLERAVKEVVTKIQKTTTAHIFDLLESELYWLEKRLVIETEALTAKTKTIEKLLSIAVSLKARIDMSAKLMVNTPIGKALESEAKSVDKLSSALKKANDEKTINNLEVELALIEKRVNDELRPVGD